MTGGLPTGARGQTLAVGIALLMAAAAWFGAAAPAWDWFLDRAEQLRRKEALTRRMAALVDGLPALRRDAAAIAGGPVGNGTDTPLLGGTSDSLAAASLQQLIDEIATREGVRVGSQEILPGAPEGHLRAIPVRLTVTAPYRAFVALLQGLAEAEIPMVAGDIALRGAAASVRDAEQTVEATVTVTSYRAAKEEPR